MNNIPPALKGEGLRIGISWQGSPRHAWDRHRSCPLEQFEPIARVPGVHLISLQKGPGSEQLRALGGRFPVLSLGELLDEASGPFLDTAAVLTHLDLVVCVDTALAHLAGAVGAGMTKINVATQLNKAFTAAVRACLAADATLVDPRRYGAAGREAVAAEVARVLRVIGAGMPGPDESPGRP